MVEEKGELDEEEVEEWTTGDLKVLLVTGPSTTRGELCVVTTSHFPCVGVMEELSRRQVQTGER